LAAAQRLRFTTNHDETAWDKTPMTLFGGKAGALGASAITINMGGFPLIYNGQEVGSTVLTPLFSRSTLAWSANPDMKEAYRQMLLFRKQTPALRKGALRVFNTVDVMAFTRTLGTQEALVIVNVRNRPVDYAVPAEYVTPTWQNAQGGTEVLLSTVSLPAYGYKILRRTK
jgi:glycosidase